MKRKRPGRGQRFSSPEHSVYAISKPDHGDAYRLDEERFQYLVDSVRYARVRLTETLLTLSKVTNVSPASMITTTNDKRQLSTLGLLADHFNLIKLRQWQANGKNVNWYYPKTFTCKADGGDLSTLVNTVKNVFTSSLEGLSGEVLFRGLHGEGVGTGGMIRSRIRDSKTEMVEDVFFPEDNKWLDAKWKAEQKGKTVSDQKRTKILMKIPKLKDDRVFLNKARQSKGYIHLNYCDLIRPDNFVFSYMFGTTPMFWVIIHEASHKYARTRDINHPYSYTIEECRGMQWVHAVRNAQHYMRFAGLNWEEPQKSGPTTWNSPTSDTLAEPHT